MDAIMPSPPDIMNGPDGSQWKRYLPRTFETHADTPMAYEPWLHEPVLACTIALGAYAVAQTAAAIASAMIEKILLNHFPAWAGVMVWRAAGQKRTWLESIQEHLLHSCGLVSVLLRACCQGRHLWERFFQALLCHLICQAVLVLALASFQLFIQLGQKMKDVSGWTPAPSYADQVGPPPELGERQNTKRSATRTGPKPKRPTRSDGHVFEWQPVGPIQVPSPDTAYQAITSRPKHQHRSFEEMRMKHYDSAYSEEHPSPYPSTLDTNALCRYQNRLYKSHVDKQASPVHDTPVDATKIQSPSSTLLEATSTTASWIKYRAEQGSPAAGTAYSPHFANGTPIESIENNSFLGMARSTGSWLKSRLGDSFFSTPERSSIGSRDSFGRSTLGKRDAATQDKKQGAGDAALGLPDLLTGSPRRQFT